MKLTINNQLVTLAELRQAWLEPVTVDIGDDAQRRIAESQEHIEDVVAHGDTIYGVNTGFGLLASVRIDNKELSHLQENLVRSHAVGVGEDLDDDIVRLIMLMKIIALAEGFSGVRVELVETLCALLNAEIYPRIPSRGSVGASGDLAPLAHMASVLIGAGEARVDGTVVPAQVALSEAGIAPLQRLPVRGVIWYQGESNATATAGSGASAPSFAASGSSA